jgi:hypothetical protein
MQEEEKKQYIEQGIRGSEEKETAKREGCEGKLVSN